MKTAICRGAATGKAASRRARAMPLPCEPTRRHIRVTIRAVLMSSSSYPSPFMPMSSPNHCACSAASAWQ
jgi:hypothetical protein